MDCALFHERLDAMLDGTLSTAEEANTQAHRVACSRCDELYQLMQQEDGREPVGQFGVAAPSGLTESILARTSGSPCAHAHARLAEWVDQGLDRPRPGGGPGDRLGSGGRAHAALSSLRGALQALVHLHDDLPAFAELEPNASLVSDVLARTIPRRVWGASPSERLRGSVGRLLARPCIAWEAGYVVTLVVWLFFGASWSPLRATPAQALTLIQQGASDTQSVGVSAMAALNRRVSRFSERALGDEGGPDNEGGC
jgi:hypothetical protein